MGFCRETMADIFLVVIFSIREAFCCCSCIELESGCQGTRYQEVVLCSVPMQQWKFNSLLEIWHWILQVSWIQFWASHLFTQNVSPSFNRGMLDSILYMSTFCKVWWIYTSENCLSRFIKHKGRQQLLKLLTQKIGNPKQFSF